MIYVDEPAVSRLEVEQLLMATRRSTLESIALYGHPERISGNEFEEIVIGLFIQLTVISLILSPPTITA